MPRLAGKLDGRRIGVGGHSFGAYTAQVLGGAVADYPDEKARSFADPRVRAVLVMSGQGTGQMGLTEHSWDHLTRPMMTMTGSLDRGARGQGPDWKRQPYDRSPSGEKYHVLIEGANHFSFTGQLAGAGAGVALGRLLTARGADQKAIFDWIRIASVAFWDASVKGDAAAKDYLQSDALPAYTGRKLTLLRK